MSRGGEVREQERLDSTKYEMSGGRSETIQYEEVPSKGPESSSQLCNIDVSIHPTSFISSKTMETLKRDFHSEGDLNEQLNQFMHIVPSSNPTNTKSQSSSTQYHSNLLLALLLLSTRGRCRVY